MLPVLPPAPALQELNQALGWEQGSPLPLQHSAEWLEPSAGAAPQQAAQRYLESGGYFLLDLFNSFEVS